MKISRRIVIFLIVLPTLVLRLSAQSTSETVTRLEQSLNTICEEFTGQLKKTAENPDAILRDDIKGATTKIVSELESLTEQINGAVDIVTKKETDLTSSPIPQKEKKELLSIIADQKAPLVRLRGRISQVKKKADTIEKEELAAWKQTYSEYESIKGRDSAKEKLSSLIKSSLASVPQLAEAFAKPARITPPKSGLEVPASLSLTSQNHPPPLSSTTASPSNTNIPVQSATPTKPEHYVSIKDESFFQYPRSFVVIGILSILSIILGGILKSDSLLGLGFCSIFLAVPIWLIWLVYLWVLRVIASWGFQF